MIVIITGQSGNGKSSWMITEIRRLVNEGRPVFTIGIPKLKLPVVEWKRSQLRNWHDIVLPEGYTLDDLEREGAIYDQDGNEIPCPLLNLPDGAAVFVDEGQKSWPPSGSKATPDQMALSMHRHWGLDFYVASQSPRFLHQSLTENCSQHIHIHKTWRGSIMLQFGEAQANPTATSIRETAYQKKYKPDPTTFSLYESASTHTKIKYGIPKRAIFSGLVFLMLPFAAYAFYHVVKSRAQPTVSPGQSQKTQQVQTVSQSPVVSPFVHDWYITGFSKINDRVTFIIENSKGEKRYVHNPDSYQKKNTTITMLYEGMLITNNKPQSVNSSGSYSLPK